uniref:Ig-like domain-containing protein n=1 Tax=Electrophorus electricus TaxID=8005 RepID=A0AAY5E9L1_ELEEL
HIYSTLLYVNEGDNITVTCLYQSDIDMHFSWYKHAFSQKPELIATIYKYDTKATFYDGFKNNARFILVIREDRNHLVITELEVSDSATYYCGNAQSNIVKFGKATKSIPVLEPVHPGNFVTLQCTVLTENYSCSGEHSVYWFRHGSNKSRPEIIYTHGNRSDQCKTDSDAGSPTWTCVYDLPRSYTRHSGGGTYYCAVAACGEILFGNGTKVDVEEYNLWIVTALATSSIFNIIMVVLVGILFKNQQKGTFSLSLLLFCNNLLNVNTY